MSEIKIKVLVRDLHQACHPSYSIWDCLITDIAKLNAKQQELFDSLREQYSISELSLMPVRRPIDVTARHAKISPHRDNAYILRFSDEERLTFFVLATGLSYEVIV